MELNQYSERQRKCQISRGMLLNQIFGGEKKDEEIVMMLL